jgi:hypothetical protein
MKLEARFWLAICLPLLVSGCLLPQPDTPPIVPPGAKVPSNQSAGIPMVGPTAGAATNTANPTASASSTPDQGASTAASPDTNASAAASPDTSATAAASPKPSPTPSP